MTKYAGKYVFCPSDITGIDISGEADHKDANRFYLQVLMCKNSTEESDECASPLDQATWLADKYFVTSIVSVLPNSEEPAKQALGESKIAKFNLQPNRFLDHTINLKKVSLKNVKGVSSTQFSYTDNHID